MTEFIMDEIPENTYMCTVCQKTFVPGGGKSAVCLGCKNLKALIAEPDTPELIQEVSRRVYEAQGECAHRNSHKGPCGCAEHGTCDVWYMYCPDCEETNSIAFEPFGDIPDVTRPEVFWPLVEKHKLCLIPDGNKWYVTDNLFDVEKYESLEEIGKRIFNDTDAMPKPNAVEVVHEEPGIAVGIAVLTIKEER